MNLKKWQFVLFDMANEKTFLTKKDLSSLANAVDFLNLFNTQMFPQSVRLLEVGCGAQSMLKDNLKVGSDWEGIDVLSVTPAGEQTIATRIASVSDIPFEDGAFDIVYSNQSIEHWYEYSVSLEQGLKEINRVLVDGGKAIINFPVHLHGHKFFVTGDFLSIDKAFENSNFEITKRTAVIDSRLPNYCGWRLCGFPDFYVEGAANSEQTSYVVEYEAKKMKCCDFPLIKNKKFSKKLSSLQRARHHGYKYLAWKIVNKIFKWEKIS